MLDKKKFNEIQYFKRKRNKDSKNCSNKKFWQGTDWTVLASFFMAPTPGVEYKNPIPRSKK